MTKDIIGIYSKIKDVTNVTRIFKEYPRTNAPTFMPLINLTASLLHKRCKKSLTTAKLKSLFVQFASETGFTHP
jgi:hypothetical protein